MWLIATFAQTSLFSLKASHATSSGGKSNLVPTMYSFKMALIDAAFRSGLDGKKVFNLVKPLKISFRPPEKVVVNNSFVKILREPKTPIPGQPYSHSVGYREFVYYGSDLKIALGINEISDEDVEMLKCLLWHVNYLGKRGSFVQLKKVVREENLSLEFSLVPGAETLEFSPDGVVQFLDDFGAGTKFDNINSYGTGSVKLGKDRIFSLVMLPLRQKSSSRGYTLFESSILGTSDY